MNRRIASKHICWLIAGSALAVCPTADAQIFTGPGLNAQQRTDGGKVVGITLNAEGLTITSLGFYDSGDGLSTSYQLGLWDDQQNLLATATVTPSSPLTDDFRYAAITPVTIGAPFNPEAFTIGTLLPSDMQDVWLEDAQLNLFMGLTGAGTGQYTTSGSLVYPSTLDESPYYVVNANGPADPLVPEPGSLALAFVATVIGTLRRRRR